MRLLVVAVLVLGCAVTAERAASAGPSIAAHRGGAALWPENSLLAFKNALALGADYLETDVHLTADDEVVVMHDATLDRTTTGSGAVRAARLADLAKLHLKARDGTVTDERVPTLAALLDLLAPSRAQLLLEIKVDPDRRRYPGIEDKVLALVRARGLIARVIVMAFEDDTIRRVGALDPSIRTALLVARGRFDRGLVPSSEAVRWAVETGATHLGIEHGALDAGVIEAARTASIHVAAWTVNDEAAMRRVIDLGAELLITDRPDLALRLVGR